MWKFLGTLGMLSIMVPVIKLIMDGFNADLIPNTTGVTAFDIGFWQVFPILIGLAFLIGAVVRLFKGEDKELPQ